jgi:hypothetical protein
MVRVILGEEIVRVVVMVERREVGDDVIFAEVERSIPIVRRSRTLNTAGTRRCILTNDVDVQRCARCSNEIVKRKCR